MVFACHFLLLVGKLIGYGIENRPDGVKTPGRGADACDGVGLNFLLLFNGFDFILSGRHVQ
jgi:hypothetical protein